MLVVLLMVLVLKRVVVCFDGVDVGVAVESDVEIVGDGDFVFSAGAAFEIVVAVVVPLFCC